MECTEFERVLPTYRTSERCGCLFPEVVVAQIQVDDPLVFLSGRKNARFAFSIRISYVGNVNSAATVEILCKRSRAPNANLNSAGQRFGVAVFEFVVCKKFICSLQSMQSEIYLICNIGLMHAKMNYNLFLRVRTTIKSNSTASSFRTSLGKSAGTD